MSVFELPPGLDADLRKALATLHQCYDTMNAWGTWHDVPFAPENFSTLSTAPGTWSVSAANVKALKYEVVHHVMTVAFEIIQAPVSGPVSGLMIRLPLPYECLPGQRSAPRPCRTVACCSPTSA
jgi:hypothetical protein